mgnify:CR=1 FL=1
MNGTDPGAAARPSPEDDAVALCRDLLRIDSSNYGDGSGPGERAAAEYVMAALAGAGWEPELMESAPRRASVVLRIPGVDPNRPALVLHGHTEVVPARAEEWSVDPFGGEEIDGMLWGRGAVDMKNMDAMILALARDMGRTGWRPPRDLVVAMFADEEAGGRFGARWVVDNRPELFAGATEAVSEVGGFSVEVAGRRVYLLQTAEKGLAATRVKVYDAKGGLESVVAPPGLFDERPNGPVIVLDVAIDSAGRVLVLDPSRRQVRVFTPRTREGGDD